MSVRADTLEAHLARIFTGAEADGASWFALTGGERLFGPGDPADVLYLVRSGRLGVFRHEEGQAQQFIGVIRPGEPAGEMSLLAGTPHTSMVVALRDTEILALSREAFLKATASRPEVMIEMARLAILRAREKTARAAEPTVFGFVAARSRPVRPFVDMVAEAIQAQGFTCRIIDSSALSSAAEWMATVEQTHDFVLYVAEVHETTWASLCARQVDRLFMLGDAMEPPPPLPASGLSREQHQLIDLIMLRGPRQERPRKTGVWLDALEPARWFHAAEGSATDAARIARVVTGTSVGLVLSGGGARAYAHIGAVRALAEAGTPFDFIGGSSMGAIIGAGVALGWSQAELEHRIRSAFVEGAPLSDAAFPIIAMTQGRKVAAMLAEHFGEIDMADMPLPFFCGATNLTTGGYQVSRRGLLRQALRASISLPGVMPPVVEDGHVLVDGAVIKNLPADIMRAWHRGPVVAVDVTRANRIDPTLLENPKSWWRWFLSGDWRQGPPIVSILMRSATVTTQAELEASRKATDLLIAPELGGVEIRNWKAYEPAVAAGEAAAQAALAGLDGPIEQLRLRRSAQALGADE
jgi:NTE family protein